MIRLLKIELKKILPNRTFWVLIILYVILLGFILTGIQSFIKNSGIDSLSPGTINAKVIRTPLSMTLYNFPDIWHNICYFAGYFKLILAIIIIIFITNEFEYKTIKQNVINGLSRFDFLISKLWTVFLLSIGSTLFIFLLGLFLGLLNSPSKEINIIFSKTEYLFAYFLQMFTYLTFAFLIGFLVKKSGLAIGLLLLYTIVIEPIICYKLPDNIADYMPLKAINNLIQIPNNQLTKLAGLQFNDYIAGFDIGISFAYIIIFIGIIYLFLKKRDL